MDAQSYWDNHYQSQPSPIEPNPFLVDMKPRMQKGKVLDIGMGEGHNAVYLANQGFQVKGFDISKVAVEKAQALADQQQAKIEAKATDLDLYLMGLMEYDSIVMTYFKPPVTRYYSELVRALKQGGTLLVESYTTEEIKEPIGKDEAFKNFYFGSNELLHQLKGMKILFYNEGVVRDRHMVQCLAKKPADKDALKYNLFDMHSKGQEKKKSNQMELVESFFKKKD